MHTHRRHLALAALLAALLPALAGAQAFTPCGERQPRPLPSFWCVRPGATVHSQGGEVWAARGEDGAPYDVVTAQGDWRALAIDGASVEGSVWQTWLPLVGAP